MKKTVTLLASVAVILVGVQAGLAQSSADLKSLKGEIEALKAKQKSIQRDLEIIKKFLRERLARRSRSLQPFKPVVLSIAGDPFKGDKNAKVTLVDFSDYQ